jgi:hypothetical protein
MYPSSFEFRIKNLVLDIPDVRVHLHTLVVACSEHLASGQVDDGRTGNQL